VTTDRLSGKTGEFDRCRRKIGDLAESPGAVWENVLTGKNVSWLTLRLGQL